MSKEFIGACRFCGQVCTSEKEFLSQIEADDYATEWCGCDEAQEYRDRLEAIRTAKANVYLLFGIGCEKFSFSPIPDDSLRLLETLVDAIASKGIGAVTLKLACGDIAKISVTAKGAIKVNRSKNISSTVES